MQNKHKKPFDYRPKYHFTPQKGWINDPNGFSYYKGYYHLFYQHFPHDTKAGTMHWGHARSKDLIKWEHLPIALYPDSHYDCDGCWSGSAIVKDDILYLLYTGVSKDKNGVTVQTQNLAYSTDGITFIKHALNPVIKNDDIKEWSSQIDFRDPYIIKRAPEDYIVLIGTKNAEEAFVVAYHTKDLKTYTYHGVTVQSKSHGSMFECPTYFTKSNKGLLILSPQDKLPVDNDFWNVSSSIYQVNEKEDLSTKITLDNVHEIDHGLDFYAPQTVTRANKTYMIAWMYMWGRTYYLDEINNTWIHNMTLPREVTIENDKLVQLPIKTLANYYANKKEREVIVSDEIQLDDISGSTIRLNVNFEVVPNQIFTIKLLKKGDAYAYLQYNEQTKLLIIDRRNSGIDLGGLTREKSHRGYRQVTVIPINGHINLEIFLDVVTIEIFINGGINTMSMLSFSKGKSITFTSSKSVKAQIVHQDINVK